MVVDVKDYPLLLNTNGVKGTLDGTKTQTRRLDRLGIINANPDDWWLDEEYQKLNIAFGGAHAHFVRSNAKKGEPSSLRINCPYGEAGARLWVRETWMLFGYSVCNSAFIHYKASFNENGGERLLQLPEDRPTVLMQHKVRKWQPSIHMPKWASRIPLEIVGVRVERLLDITEEDARAEGVKAKYVGGFITLEHQKYYKYKDGFIDYWDNIYAQRGYGRESNPFVWVILYRMISGG